MSTERLPPFLTLETSFSSQSKTFVRAGYYLRDASVSTPALWWPWRDSEHQPKTVIIFIPGNPGLSDFYIPFLSEIPEHSSSRGTAIFSISHVGHAPQTRDIGNAAKGYFSLDCQVKHALNAFDDVRTLYGVKTKVVLVGHSVGSWITLQIVKARARDVSGAFLLFPTIRHIADTPNGRRLSWLFRWPVPQVLSRISPITSLLPRGILSSLFSHWPHDQILVLRKFLASGSSVLASLTMARDEMHTIKDLDVEVLTSHKMRLWFYFAEHDDWVGTNREVILRELQHVPMSTFVVHGTADVPHAFCINHGSYLAEQCIKWLEAGEFL